MELIHQPVREQRADQRPAAADVDAAIHAVLDGANLVGVVRTGDLRVSPDVAVLQGARDNVLRGIVHERGAGVFGGGPLGPCGREHLKGPASEQYRLAWPHGLSDGVAHLGSERVPESERRVFDYPVEGDELVNDDLAHCGLLL